MALDAFAPGCSPVAFEVPLLTNHLKLQRLDLDGMMEIIIPVLGRLPLFAPRFLVGICIYSRFTDEMKGFEGISEDEWKAVDLALCDSKFTHLKSVELVESGEKGLENPHAFFRQALPKSYERGILWFRHYYAGMYLIAIILHHSDLCRPTYSHCFSGLPTVPRSAY